MRFTLTREFYVPKGAVKIADKQSDAVAYVFATVTGKPAARIFWGRGAKPIQAHYYTSEKARENAVVMAFDARRAQLGRKATAQEERKNFVHAYKVGDVLHTCWGYEQTNREFFEVTEVRGKWLILREIGQARTETGWARGDCVPLPGAYIGEPIRRLAGQYGVKIDDVRSAWKTEPKMVAGVPVHEPIYWTAYH